jgi:hypothetical protein
MSLDVTSGRRIEELEMMVADLIIETPDTTTLVLFTRKCFTVSARLRPATDRRRCPNATDQFRATGLRNARFE